MARASSGTSASISVTHLQAADLRLLDHVEVCPICDGLGAYDQRFREGRFISTCDYCREPGHTYAMGPAAGLVYKGTRTGVPESVIAQVLNQNKASRARTMSGVWEYMICQ